MTLIIAEKPSLARNIVAGIQEGGNRKMTSRGSYFEGCGYVVTWAFGHLFSLCDIEAYSPSPDGSGKWTMENLPCFPKEFRFDLRRGADRQVDAGVKRQFDTIRTLCAREDVDTVVNAGDADREGEIIVRLCVQNALPAGEKKAFRRLWLPDQTPKTVQAALAGMKDETEYDNLAAEGFARTYIDWLYGVNLTRYATLRCGKLLRVGRVIVPIVKAIYDRDMAIRNFRPETYYAIVSSAMTGGQTVELTSKTKFTREEKDKAQAFCDEYNKIGAVVVSTKSKPDTLAPGKLYSLSKLQNVLGKKYKMSMADSLAAVQKLYEMGYVTYPRTNSEYLATNEQEKVKGVIRALAAIGYPVVFKNKKTIFDDSKIESHSALTPTYKIPDKNALSTSEMQVYSTIVRRFAAVFCEKECRIHRSEIRIAVGDRETFTLKGTVMVEPGWTKYDDSSLKDKVLPELHEGDAVNIDFKPTEKETTPPRHYTIETLNNYLKNPFREEKAAAAEAQAQETGEAVDDAEDYRAIFEGLELGTEATRTGIIDNARNTGYIELKKDVYSILPDGEFLIESLARMQISMDKYKTSQMGQALKKVYHGKMSVRESVALAEEEITAIFHSHPAADPSEDQDFGFMGDVVGKCPLCGGDVVRTRYGYGCSAYRSGCKFSVNVSICKRIIPVSAMRDLLEKGRTGILKGFVSKTGKSFDAALKLDQGRAVFDFGR